MMRPTAADHSVLDPTTARLLLRADLVFTRQVSSADAYYVVEDLVRSKFFRVGVPEYTLISHFDGKTSIAAAIGAVASRLGDQAISPADGLAIAQWLVDAGLASPVDQAGNIVARSLSDHDSTERRRESFNPLAVKLTLFNPDALLGKLLPFAAPAFGWLGVMTWIFTWSVACYLVLGHWDNFASEARAILNRDHWLGLFAAWLGLKVLHESAHALACKNFGGSVLRTGVMLIFFSPVAFVDVTSSWRFASKWQRIIVSAAGMYVELFVAALALIFWAQSIDGPAHRAALAIAAMASFATFVFNANPLMRFDGYFILSDLLEIPNLYSRSQQSLIGVLKHYLLGSETSAADRVRQATWFIAWYGIASLLWRVSLYVSLVLLAVSLLGYLGAALAFAWTLMHVVVPWARALGQFLAASPPGTVSLNRLMFLGSAGIAVAGLASWLLLMPGKVEAPAIVEYAPLAVVRAGSPGFVREVLVHSGQLVEQGQMIAVLGNDELQAELKDLDLAIEQSTIKTQIHMQSGDQPKLQVEKSQQQALKKRRAELRKQLDSLVIRSPQQGEVVGRRLASLVGQYLQTGDEIAVVGTANAKELIVSAPQEDIDLLLAQVDSPVRVAVRGDPGGAFDSPLVSVNPRAAVDLPHAALSAHNGGTLEVKIRPVDDTPKNASNAYELLRPGFVGRISLSPDESARLLAGQPATVSFRSANATIGGRFYQAINRWIQQRVGRTPAG
jgi:putative peptide zinc metalloprotease protein